MTLRDGPTAIGDPAPAGSPEPDAATDAVPDPLGDAIRRHPTSLGRHLDVYLDAVARELQARGVLAGPPQRSDPSQRLIGSIVVDCTAMRDTAWTERLSITGQHAPAGQRALGDDPVREVHPAPVIVTWDEITGWCAGLHHDSTRSSRRYLHPDVLPPAAAVAEFVVGLAMGRPVGASQPLLDIVRPHLRLIR
jgi:hypothetical protein